jgi:hypothetical protein
MDTADDDAAAGWHAHPEAAEPRGRLPFTLDVDGERSAIRAHDGGTDYDWISGPNKDYGFSSSGGQDMPEEWHRESIRNFLSMIDPETGYIADD